MGSTKGPPLTGQANETVTGQQNASTEQVNRADLLNLLNETRRREAEREHDRLNDFHRYVNEATIKTGELALRMLLLVNGGAAVALLTFIGTLPKDQKVAMANTLVSFAFGVALAAAGIAMAYLTNYFTGETTRSLVRTWDHPYSVPGPKTGLFTFLNIVFHIAAVALGIASLSAFVCGMLDVRSAFTHLN
jgi:hypothetical protein